MVFQLKAEAQPLAPQLLENYRLACSQNFEGEHWRRANSTLPTTTRGERARSIRMIGQTKPANFTNKAKATAPVAFEHGLHPIDEGGRFILNVDLLHYTIKQAQQWN
ncbi:MAG: hypothetical protein M2R45_01203 [Verrucomicrobia subdivision 3 bacterium]|nr:hypothetical protein [Limisphaerales bacterium]MCS1415245.1 hypothetical protein [Limisphaerales bacterium]